MPKISDAQGILRENLLDAGCDEALTRRVMELIGQGERHELLTLLAKRRKELLECCHAEQKKLDCLDYLIYRMEKEPEGQ